MIKNIHSGLLLNNIDFRLTGNTRHLYICLNSIDSNCAKKNIIFLHFVLKCLKSLLR